MQVPDLFPVPFLTDCKFGNSYGEMHKIPKEMLENPDVTEEEILALLDDHKSKVEAKAEIMDKIVEPDEEEEAEIAETVAFLNQQEETEAINEALESQARMKIIIDDMKEFVKNINSQEE